jgi:ABC-type transport system involved in cytochrome bd biosynthesis fused ATPase/permease subunit
MLRSHSGYFCGESAINETQFYDLSLFSSYVPIYFSRVIAHARNLFKFKRRVAGPSTIFPAMNNLVDQIVLFGVRLCLS